MKEETKDKEMCTSGCGTGHGGKIGLYMLLGTVAVVYGIMNYLTTVMMWPMYTAWIVGGFILVLIGWAKKKYMMGMCGDSCCK